jgi:hypothetical protein
MNPPHMQSSGIPGNAANGRFRPEGGVQALAGGGCGLNLNAEFRVRRVPSGRRPDLPVFSSSQARPVLLGACVVTGDSGGLLGIAALAQAAGQLGRLSAGLLAFLRLVARPGGPGLEQLETART